MTRRDLADFAVLVVALAVIVVAWWVADGGLLADRVAGVR